VKKTLTLVVALLSMATISAVAAVPHHSAKKKMAPKSYVCAKCHMKFTAAQAKKDHYKDPMDGGKLVPAPAKKKPMSHVRGESMPGMKM